MPAQQPPALPPSPAPKPTHFAFPFRGANKKPIVDEHVLHGWLASEPTGNFAFSQSGMWHGGIHVSADGAGKHLDLAHGVRCIADGHVIAHLIHRDYLTSEIAAAEGEAARSVQYSRAFTLVRHTLEYPANNRLTFFSLYMHLQSLEDYRQQGVTVPAYWPKAYEVTEYTTNRPLPHPVQGAAAPDQVGQNIRSQPNLGGTVLGVLQRGARVRIGVRSPDRKWGRIEAIESGTVLPPKVATLSGQGAQTGWVFLAKEQGHWPLAEVVSEALCDQTVTPTPIPIKAGDLIGHLGQYWSLNDPTQPNRQVHIEVFCGDTLPAFLAASREAGRNITDFGKLPLLRIDQGVKLYKGPSLDEEGKDAPQTAVVQIYSQAALDAFPAEDKGPKDNANGDGQPWWRITSANSLHNDITGWVRNRQTPAGRVTRESPHTWQDFEVFEVSDSNPTLFESTDAWLDHALREDKPNIHDVSKLNPLTREMYHALSPMRTESNAAFELRAHGENRWTRFRASRLIPKHRSEWASQAQYEDFFETALKRIQREPYLDAEIARIQRLTWWDEVSSKVSQPFPASPEVFHIHPVALVGNFSVGGCSCGKPISMKQLQSILPSDVRQHGLFYKAHCATVRNFPIDEFLSILTKNMEKYGILNCIHKAHFLSQFTHECDQLRTNEEYRNQNGSIPSGWNNYQGGSNYHGRGLIQLTHNYNYARYGRASGNSQIATNPDIVSQQVAHTIESACWYWRKGSAWGDINPMAERSDFLNVTIAVNGGYNHVVERNRLLMKLAQLIGLDACRNTTSIKLKNFTFSDSSARNSIWYATHPQKVEQVESALSNP